MSNGMNNYFWEVGLAHSRMAAGFFTPADLERLDFIRQNRQPFAGASINNATVERPTNTRLSTVPAGLSYWLVAARCLLWPRALASLGRPWAGRLKSYSSICSCIWWSPADASPSSFGQSA
jgi:hypothetical protein